MAVEITVRYVGGLACEATHGPSGSSLRTTPPKDNGGDGSRFSPTDLMATALGTCALTIMAMTAERRKIDLSGVVVKVEKHMSAEPPRKIARLPVTFTFPFRPSEEDRRALENAAHGCPVHRSLPPDMDAPIHFAYPPA